MKAIATCPKCEEKLTTNCNGCIGGDIYGCSEGNEKMHKCKEDYDIIENVKWKKVPETESELNEVERK